MPTRHRRKTETGIETAEETASRAIYDGFAMPAGALPARRPGDNSAPARMPGKSASAAATRRAAMRANLSGEAAHKYASIMSAGLRDVLTDEEAAINAGFTEGVEVPVPENLPAVISRQIATTGGEIVPEWHMVKRLPGYLRNQVRAFGRLVLSQFTDTPIEDIQTVTTLTNDEIEVRALMAWIKANGIRDDRAEMDFGQTIPGYRADVQIWNVKDYSFLLVKDFAGYYVYGWPGGRGVHLENDAPRPLLR